MSSETRPRGLLGGRARRLLTPPLVLGRPATVRAAGGELQHRGRDGFQEPAIVGDEDHSRVERLELPFEPFEALDVEVVRRLVEQEQVRIDRKRARQRGARELSPEKVASFRSKSSSRNPSPRAAWAIRSRQFQPPACSSRACASAYLRMVASSCAPAVISFSRRRSSSSTASRSRAPERTQFLSVRLGLRRGPRRGAETGSLGESELASLQRGPRPRSHEGASSCRPRSARRARAGRGDRR